MDGFQMPVAVGDLEALSLQRDRAVGTTLSTFDLDAEGRTQGFARGTLPPDTGASEVALQRRRADLLVQRPMIVQLYPRMDCAIQQLQGQLVHALKHGQQPTFGLAPEGLLLTILERAIKQCRTVLDA